MDEFPKSGEVTTVGELHTLLRRVGGFHDGVIKEMHWVNRDAIDGDLTMRTYQGSVARLFVQRQWKDPSAVEMRLYGVKSIHLETEAFVFESMAKAGEDGALVLDIDGSVFVFERLSYRFASDWMGEEIRLGENWLGSP